MTGHVLETAWHCLGCGGTIPKGSTVHRDGERWRCAACLGLPQPAVVPPRRERRPEPPRKSRQREPVQGPPGSPNFANREKPHSRYHKGTTLEELLRER